MTELHIRIVGRDLPGLRFSQYSGVHVGMQRGGDVIGVVPGDSPEAVFEFSVGVVDTPDGPDFRGPFVHGRRGERFLYLSWGELGTGGEFAMFRRAKLHLSLLDPGEVMAAVESGARLQGTLSLTDGRGGPLCASVRPPAISWEFR